jgi:hypothetical protein
MSAIKVGTPNSSVQQSATKGRGGYLKNYFYFTMALVIPAIVMFGFSFTIGPRIIRPAIPRPTLLYVHAAVFAGWLVFFFLQSALVRIGNVKLHRWIGWFGVGYGAMLVVLGVATAIVMARFNIRVLHHPHAAVDLIVSLWDMVVFTTAMGFAIYRRRKSEYHRRLVYVATCEMTPAAFGRMPLGPLIPFFYVGMDTLILLGMVRDWVVNRKVHPVYLYALPLLIAGQMVVMYTLTQDPPFWIKIAHALLGER